MGFFVVALVLTALTTSAFAQGGGNITGTVKDKSGNPIIGAAVTIPNTARGTSTDIDGRYTIKASAKESLNFSYIGYQSQLIQINNRTTIDVVLTEDNTSLEEVVVVGYGVQKKRDIVGAVEQISSKDIADRIGSYQNVSRSLQGAIPGLTVGCLLFNISNAGALPLDWLVGTGATLLATTCMYLLRRATLWKLPLPALLMPAVWNAVLVGWELTYYIGEIPFWLNAVYVAAGEAAVLLVLGTALYFALGSRRLQERLFPQGV